MGTSEHSKGLEGLVNEMRAADTAGVPIVWQVPTTINDSALNSDEKREKMTESKIQEIRQKYITEGVNEAASFVIDGTSFTAEQVAESHDGVHYPAYVYDAGVQILLNSFDWLVPAKHVIPKTPDEPGKNANVTLGALMLFLSFLGLFLFDGYFGASVLVSKIFLGETPAELYAEAMAPVHEKHGLPPLTGAPSSATAETEDEKIEDMEMLLKSSHESNASPRVRR